MKRKLLITGGAGFIGSHVVRLFLNRYPQYHIINLDSLTYAANLSNLQDVEQFPNYTFIKGDICDEALVESIFDRYEIDSVIHLAAQTHVDRSLINPQEFVTTNVNGTAVLLQSALKRWKEGKFKLFHHISTDEVFGSIEDGYFHEDSPYRPNSPYSATKAASDHLVRAYGASFDLPYVITNCTNNYGPNQFPEKLMPLIFHNLLHQLPLPVYGDGLNVRDWVYVIDHAEAIDCVFHMGKSHETYLIGNGMEYKNIDIVYILCSIMDKKLSRKEGTSAQLIRFVTDRPGHDRRYALDTSKIHDELGWVATTSLADGLEKTVDWYLNNNPWLEKVVSGAYKDYYQLQYSAR